MSNNQTLALLVNANGSGSGAGPIGSPMQWFGGKAKVFAWKSSGLISAGVEVSPDGGTTWIRVVQISSVGDMPQDISFSEPSMLVRGVGDNNSASQNLNITIIGYDEAE